MKAKKSKPRGRPALAPEKKKRRNFTFRGTDQLHEAISGASAISGRSLSEEIEWRVGQSFFMQDVVQWAVAEAIQKALAYVDEQRAKEEAERNRPRPFSDIFKTNEDKK
jgi:hypothetical protein